MNKKNIIVDDNIFSLLVQLNLEKNFLEAKKRPRIHDIQEGYENGSSIGLFVATNSKNLVDFIHDDIVFYDIEKLDLKKFLLDHAEPKKDGALIITDTKISDNVFFYRIVSDALKKVNMKKIDQIARRLLPENFSVSNANKIEIGSKTRTAISIPVVCKESKSYLIKKSVYKDLEEGTGKVVRFGCFGLEMEFYFSCDNFLPLHDNFFFDEKKTIGVIKTYNYNRITKKVENTSKFVVNANLLLKNEGLVVVPYPAQEKLDLMIERIKTKKIKV